MRRLVIVILMAALGVVAATTGAQATGVFGLRTSVTVTPANGTPTTTFTARFKTPLTTGSSQELHTWEIVSVADNRRPSASCTSTTATRVAPAVAHHRVSVALSATPWCAGRYTGTITLYREIVCGGPIRQRAACPDLAFAPEPIGHFRFGVAPAS